jgi:hypothetical protein
LHLLRLLPMATSPHQNKEKVVDHVAMKKGKMMVTKDGESKPMLQDITLKNGTKVMIDGTMVMKDGIKKMLKDDDMIDMEGEPIKGAGQKEGTKGGSPNQ